jgi:hypothetical protein
MGLKSAVSKPLAKWAMSSFYQAYQDPVMSQFMVLEHLLRRSTNTTFGKDHRFVHIHHGKDFAQAVPVRDYEQIIPYIERIKEG